MGRQMRLMEKYSQHSDLEQLEDAWHGDRKRAHAYMHPVDGRSAMLEGTFLSRRHFLQRLLRLSNVV